MNVNRTLATTLILGSLFCTPATLFAADQLQTRDRLQIHDPAADVLQTRDQLQARDQLQVHDPAADAAQVRSRTQVRDAAATATKNRAQKRVRVSK